ncbi:GlxA family transcriptional regulator [Antrihabitans cavernicola]|uniref:Helix-turn-helix domain-containing protein n=1 Tax=Antrihabitans cavernicola TaxID=2495913 RepID=A0A5A7SEU6_9NOCA|nr:helix-turn-helix domain-containing protein [Spelaeibacter cavernicola]KAA0023045.1 helix-turn-helix domain-containing protein [Spelaeibacter cavernicola]
MRSVAVLAFDNISPFHLSVPTLVFGAAGLDSFDSDYRVEVCAETPGPMTTPAGYDIVIRHGLDAFERADTVVIPSWIPAKTVSPGLRDALHLAHHRGARIVGLCLGSWAIAESGLADGRDVVTHWSAAKALAATFPHVNVRSDVLWSDLGDIVTSAGVAAALDCCLHLVRSEHGSAYAMDLARTLVLAPHRNGSQAQYIPVPIAADADHDPIEHAMVWARTNLAEPVELDQWAAVAVMSRRTFTRRFRERTGSSPQQWLLQQRADRARLLLESTSETVERIADRTGFGTAVTMRHHFGRILGTSPAAHRASFQDRSSVTPPQ